MKLVAQTNLNKNSKKEAFLADKAEAFLRKR
jgi:hypothetical protein